jgi:hypothetical protein
MRFSVVAIQMIPLALPLYVAESSAAFAPTAASAVKSALSQGASVPYVSSREATCTGSLAYIRKKTPIGKTARVASLESRQSATVSWQGKRLPSEAGRTD